MVYESRVGDVFILGASTWRINEITADRVEVVPAPGEPGATMPFWHGDMLGRTIETGRALGAFTRQMGKLERSVAEQELRTNFRLDELAASNLAGYLEEELAATGHLPSDRTIVVQRFRDEIGDWRAVRHKDERSMSSGVTTVLHCDSLIRTMSPQPATF